MKESDKINTSFITPFGAFCYITMPLDLKNTGATYQRIVQNCLHSHIGRNVQVYVADVVMKSANGADLLADLAETFASLTRYDMKLNPEKCFFRVPSGKLLYFIVSAHGIEANLEKISAILNMGKPRELRDVQNKTG